MNALEGRSSKSLRAERARIWWVVGGGAVAIARMLREGVMLRMTPWRVSAPAIVVCRRTLHLKCLFSTRSLYLRCEWSAKLKLRGASFGGEMSMSVAWWPHGGNERWRGRGGQWGERKAYFAPMAALSAVSSDTIVPGAPEAGGGDFAVVVGALPWRLFAISAILTQLCSGS